jgi:SAM-dependent methyltransferase
MTDNTPRVESFFSGMFVELWRNVMPHAVTQQEATFLETQLALSPGARVLDVPCGSGRHSLALASRGYQVTAVDLSSESLAYARDAAARNNLSIQFEHRDMADLPWPSTFAFCMGNSFGYASDEDDVAFLSAVWRALKPGGKFALDYGAVGEALFSNFQPRSWMPVGDTLFLRDGRYNVETGRVETDYTLIRQNQTESKSWSQRVYPYRQLKGIVMDAGFTDLRPYSSLTLEPFKFGSTRLLLIAAKAS